MLARPPHGYAAAISKEQTRSYLSFDAMSDSNGSNTTYHTTMREYQATPSHSRNSSTGSNASSPLASGFSTRGHSRWPSSTSSLATSPDSQFSLAKAALHDLVEEPAEREDNQDSTVEADAFDEFCLCDSIFCEHQQIKSDPTTPHDSSTCGDLSSDGSRERLSSSSKRRGSDGSSRDRASSSLSRGLPSFTRHWRSRSRKANNSISASSTRSAPPSRSSSVAEQFLSNPPIPLLEFLPTPPTRQSNGHCDFESEPVPDVLNDSFFLDLAEKSLGESEGAALPLSPAHPANHRNNLSCDIHSSIQYAPAARPSAAESFPGSPLPSPTSPTSRTSLSAKPSSTSMRRGFSKHGDNVPPLSLSDGYDIWAIRLGHANFDIDPEPYVPATSNSETCRQLLEDWEVARIAFMRHAAQTIEHHGLTSRTYTLTCDKWAAIDAQWRWNFETVCVRAEAVSGESPNLRPLPETRPCVNMTLLNDALNPEKFPLVDERDIVGPMVRYATPQPAEPPAATKKRAILRLLTDAASLLRKQPLPQ